MYTKYNAFRHNFLTYLNCFHNQHHLQYTYYQGDVPETSKAIILTTVSRISKFKENNETKNNKHNFIGDRFQNKIGM